MEKLKISIPQHVKHIDTKTRFMMLGPSPVSLTILLELSPGESSAGFVSRMWIDGFLYSGFLSATNIARGSFLFRDYSMGEADACP